jgi:hypothetical protein
VIVPLVDPLALFRSDPFRPVQFFTFCCAAHIYIVITLVDLSIK